MQERFEVFTVLSNRISRNIRKIKNQEMAEYNLRSAHVSCLYYLYQADSLTATDLCERCEEDKATISRALDYLESNGYLVEEFECEVCGSRYEIEVTATISVYSDITSIECIYEAVDELNGIDVTDLMIGDSVEIPDGMYEVGSSQYLIESGVLTAIFNDLIDENQLQFQI